MLPFLNRLPSQRVRQLFQSGRRISGEWYQLIFQKTTGMPRFGFLVSIKIDKRATVRNRIRRLLRESVHHLLPELLPYDGIIVARKNIADRTQAEVEQNLREMFHRVGLLRTDS
ncbi:MAG: ribonuclease P protein component [Patescibacteria group bacterium]